MARTLYHVEDCPQCEKIRLALALERLEYESVTVDPSHGEMVREISGQEELPVFVDEDGTVFHDTNRILQRLAGRPGSKLLPDGRRDQMLTRVLVDRADSILAPLLYSIVRNEDPEGNSLREDDLLVLERRLEEELAVLEGLLERGPYLFGDHPTLADICTHAFLSQLPRFGGRPLPDSFLRVSSWYKRVKHAAAAG